MMKMRIRATTKLTLNSTQFATHLLRSAQLIAVPMLIAVPEQALPVYYTLFARLTTGTLSFSKQSIDYGNCYNTQQCEQTLR